MKTHVHQVVAIRRSKAERSFRLLRDAVDANSDLRKPDADA